MYEIANSDMLLQSTADRFDLQIQSRYKYSNIQILYRQKYKTKKIQYQTIIPIEDFDFQIPQRNKCFTCNPVVHLANQFDLQLCSHVSYILLQKVDKIIH